MVGEAQPVPVGLARFSTLRAIEEEGGPPRVGGRRRAGGPLERFTPRACRIDMACTSSGSDIGKTSRGPKGCGPYLYVSGTKLAVSRCRVGSQGLATNRRLRPPDPIWGARQVSTRLRFCPSLMSSVKTKLRGGSHRAGDEPARGDFPTLLVIHGHSGLWSVARERLGAERGKTGGRTTYARCADTPPTSSSSMCTWNLKNSFRWSSACPQQCNVRTEVGWSNGAPPRLHRRTTPQSCAA